MYLGNRDIVKKYDFTINPDLHEYSWRYHCKQYISVFKILLDTARQKKYRTNIKSMPFLFIMRHSLELLLKYNIDQQGHSVLETHNLKDLLAATSIYYDTFDEDFKNLSCQSEGDCFRYLTDTNGRDFFNGQDIACFDLCQKFIKFYNLYKPSGFNNISSLEEHVKLKDELNFRIFTDRTIGRLATQYDFAIAEILDSILKNEVQAQDVYVPLLFLIRHSLELKLKFNEEFVDDKMPKIDKKNIGHSVGKLWNIFMAYIGNSIEQMNDDGWKKISITKRAEVQKFTGVISNLDSNSMLFRFPDDPHIHQANTNYKNNTLTNVIRMYIGTDSFLCFVCCELVRHNVLKLSPNIINKYFSDCIE